MTPRFAAILGGLVSVLALGVAIAQIMPADRSRMPNAAQLTPSPSATTPKTDAAKPARPPETVGEVTIIDDIQSLDPRIRRTHERLMEAARSGNTDRLLTVFQMNETMPIFSRGNEKDPVAFWKQASGDGEGHEVLAILSNILELPAALINKGSAREMLVWPYLAHISLDKLTPVQSVDLYRLMTAQDVRDMKTLGKWVFWRVGIGKDGTLHYFVAGE